MNDALTAKLNLGSIPKRVVGFSSIEFIERIEVLSLIPLVLGKGRLCPLG